MTTRDDEPRVEFWYEFASTYSYVAAESIEVEARRCGVTVLHRPFLLGPILARQGLDDSPFNIYQAKGRYMWRDVERLCLAQGIPFRRPSVFPRNGLLAARVARLGQEEPWCGPLMHRVFQANFAEDADISDPEVMAGILRQIGREPAETIERALRPDNKERLRRQTEDAATLGIFGAPSLFVNGELFWGSDRLQAALRWARKDTA